MRLAALILVLFALNFAGPAHAAKKPSSPPQQSSKSSKDTAQDTKKDTSQDTKKDTSQDTKKDASQDTKKDDPSSASQASQSRGAAKAASADEPSTPPDNVVDFFKWVNKPAAPTAAPSAPASAAPLFGSRAPPRHHGHGWVTQVKPAPPAAQPPAPGQVAQAKNPGQPSIAPAPPQAGQGAGTPGTARAQVAQSPSPPVTTAQAAPPAARPRLMGPGGPILPPPSFIQPGQVLGINLTKTAIEEARLLGAAPGTTVALQHLKLNVTPFSPGPVTLATLVDKLVNGLPGSDFGYNNGYRAQRSEGETDASPATAQGCLSERCYGQELIGWRPELGACTAGIKIGVIDTGHDEDHPALKMLRGAERQMFLPANRKKAPNQHGTSVLSVLGGDLSSSTPGLIPNATYLLAEAFHADSRGQPVADTLSLLKALDWLMGRGVHIINLSLAGPQDEVVKRAMQDMSKAGIVLVAAAGNDGPLAPPSYPAGYKEVIAVTAVDRRGTVYAQAGHGEHIDLAAPGVDIWAALPGRRQGSQTGTSFAAPFVTAVIAASLPKNETLAYERKEQVLTRLRKNVLDLGDRGRDPVYGWGLVQAPTQCGTVDPRTTIARGPAKPDSWDGTIERSSVGLTSTLVEPAEAATLVALPSGGPATASSWSVVVRRVLGH